MSRPTDPEYPLRVEQWSRDPLEYRVGRKRELDLCIDALTQDQQHLLIHGERGAGKTFLLRLAERELLETERESLPCYLKLSELALYAESPLNVSRYIVLKLCGVIWTRVFGRPYFELRERLTESGSEITARCQEERVLQKIYSHLSLKARSVSFQKSNSIGIGAIAKGELKEQVTRNEEQPELLAFELAELCNDLVEQILKKRGKKFAAILCDEAEYDNLAQLTSMQNLQLQILGPAGLNFVYTVATGEWAPDAVLPIGFDHELALTGLSCHDEVAELAANLLTYKRMADMTFTSSAIRAIHTCFGGLPRSTLAALNAAVRHALSEKSQSISEVAALWACRQIEEEDRRNRKLFASFANSKQIAPN